MAFEDETESVSEPCHPYIITISADNLIEVINDSQPQTHVSSL
jgi:hypothetical protein